MARINKTQYAVLGALSVRPMSGYDIKKWVLEVMGSFWAESPGQIHPTLKQLVAENLVSCDDSKGTGDRPKKIYTITRKGLSLLKDWLRQPVAAPTLRTEFVFKLFYGNLLSTEDYLAHLVRHKKDIQDHLDKYKEIAKHFKSGHIKDPGTYFRSLTLDKAICHAKTDIEWCDKMIKLFSQKLKKVKK